MTRFIKKKNSTFLIETSPTFTTQFVDTLFPRFLNTFHSTRSRQNFLLDWFQITRANSSVGPTQNQDEETKKSQGKNRYTKRRGKFIQTSNPSPSKDSKSKWLENSFKILPSNSRERGRKGNNIFRIKNF